MTRSSPITRRGLMIAAVGVAGLAVARPGLAALVATPRQTAGPYYPREKPGEADADLTEFGGRRAEGEAIEVAGRVLDLEGDPVPGATVEIWQANAFGRYRHPGERSGSPRDPGFQGFGAVTVGPDGGYRFRTVRPAPYGSGGFRRTPHIHYRIVAPGGRELVTQMYFPDEPMNAEDSLFRRLGGEAAQAAATARIEGAGPPQRLGFDVVLGA